MTKKELIAAYVNKYGRDVYSFCLHLTGNKSDADDLYQEVFLKLTEKVKTLDPDGNIKSYLLSVAVNIWRNERRRRWRKDESSGKVVSIDDVTADGALVLEMIPDEGPLPDEIAEKEETLRIVREAVSRLPERLRIATLLFYQSELSVKEIGDILHIPEGTVKSRLSQARSCIKATLKGRLVGYEYKIS